MTSDRVSGLAPGEKPPRLGRGGRSRCLVVTAAGPHMSSLMHRLTKPRIAQYAERWGFDVRAVDLEVDGSRADAAAQLAKWAKISLLREGLQEYPFALWIDADVLIARADDDITAHLHPERFQALALEHVPAEHRVNPNTGVWLMRSCPTAFEFLDAVEAAGSQPGPWADQGAVLAALGWHRGDDQYHWAGPGRGTRFLGGTSWLPGAWNQPYLEGRTAESCYNGSTDSYVGRPTVPSPYAIHFMGMTTAARHEHMTLVAASLPTPRDVAVAQDGQLAPAV